MIEIAPHATVFSTLEAAAARWPERPFLNVLEETAGIYGIEAREWTYAEAMDEVVRLKTAYEAAGYMAGGRVMLLMENRPAFFLHWFALNALGLSVVPVNPDLQSAELEYMAGHAEPVLAIAIPSRIADLAKASAASDVNFPVIAPDDTPPAMTSELAKRVVPPADDALSREAAMLYTSGTTGKPKGCVLSNLYFLAAGRWYAEAGGICALDQKGERMITPLPIFHMNAMAYSLMAMIAVGGCLTALDRFHPRTWWQSVRTSKATCLHYLGVMPSMLMKAEPSAADREHGVRFGFGAGIDPKLHEPFEKRFGIPLVEAWAMTETGAGAVTTTARETGPLGPRCIGRPSPGTDWRVVADDGSDVAPGTPGELLVRAAGDDPRAGFFSGYLDDAEATEAAWAGGWFHTGDVVTHDGAGLLNFFDRKKNVIRRSGENIAVLEVEGVLAALPEVAAVAVAPVPDDIRGEEVFALVVTRPDTSANGAAAEAIVRAAAERLSYHKLPGWIAFVEAIPVTATQKLRRGEIREEARRLLAAGAAVDLRPLKATLRHG